MLGSGRLPLSITVPEFPKIVNCDEQEEGFDSESSEATEPAQLTESLDLDLSPPALEGDEVSILELDTGFNEPCFHGLPSLFKATWEEQDFSTRAVDFGPWYDEPQDVPRTPLHNQILNLEVPSQAQPGDNINLRFTALEDLRNATIHWYIDDGTLLRTGLSGVTEFEAPSSENPFGKSTSTNIWQIPEDASGTLRVWVVVHYGTAFSFPWADPDMAWRSGQVEVKL